MPEKPIFDAFFVFFPGQKIFISPTFFKIFSGILKFSRGFFSRVGYYFSRAEILEFFAFSRETFCIFSLFFSRVEFHNFSPDEYYFLGQNSVIFCIFTGKNLHFFLGHPLFFFSGRILQFFLGNIFFFSGSFRDFFSGSFKTSRAEN